MDEETLACIKRGDLKYLESGQISKYVFSVERKKAHEQGICHLIVRLFLIAFDEDKNILYLVQKRSNDKKSYPGYYTDSASGHVEYQKNLDMNEIKLNAYRELEEEFGIPQEEVKMLKFYDLQYEKDDEKLSPEIAYIFFGLVSPNVDLYPDPVELDPNKSKFYTEDKLKAILNRENLVDYSKEIWNILLTKDMNSFFEDKELNSEGKKEAIALFLGRFQPLHKGHLSVIKIISQIYGCIKIGIGSSQFSHTKHNPFTKYERKQFIQNCLREISIPPDKVHIFFIPDLFNAKQWVKNVISIVGHFDVVVSNSDWVRSLFEQEKYPLADKILFEKEKYNGTKIRKLIVDEDEQWKTLVPKCVIDLIKKYQGEKRIRSDYRIDNM